MPRRRSVFPGFDVSDDERRALVAALVRERERLGLTQTDVAARMRTSQSAVARLETGDVDVRVSTLQRYAAAVDRDMRWRLTRRERA